MSIHEAALEGFGRGASAYERGRPSYPQPAVDWMLERLSIGPGRVVADLGAGTGKFTRLLVASGARVLAVEPVAGMRAELRRAVPAAEVVDATAQAIPVQDGELDAVTAAQAFHWFASERVLVEIHRALRPDGGLGVIFNRRDLADPVQAGLDRIIAHHRGAVPTHENDRWMDAMDQTILFTPIGTRQFTYEQALDRAGLVDQVLSISFMATLDGSQRQAVAAEVEVVAGAEAHFRLRYRTEVYLFRRA